MVNIYRAGGDTSLPFLQTTAGVAACVFGLLGVLLPGTVWAAEGESSPPDVAAAEPIAEAKEPTVIEKLSLRQQQIARDFQHLQDVLLRMAELSAATCGVSKLRNKSLDLIY